MENNLAAAGGFPSNIAEVAQFAYTTAQIHQFVKLKKTIDGGKLTYRDYDKGELSREAKVSLRAPGVGIATMTLIILASDYKNPERYHASLLLDGARIRGVDFQEKAVRKRFKEVIPKGWHQNMNSPNSPSEDRHDPLDLGRITGLAHFARKICELWNIEYEEPEGELSL